MRACSLQPLLEVAVLTLKFGDGVGPVPLLIAVAFEQDAAHAHEGFLVEGEGLEDRGGLLLEHLLARVRLRALSFAPGKHERPSGVEPVLASPRSRGSRRIAPARPLSLTRESRRSSPPQVRHSP